MKVGFFSRNSQIPDVDASRPELGNPGMGGREFMNLSVAYLLGRLRDGDVWTKLFAERKGEFPHDLSVQVVDDLFGALAEAKNQQIDFFVVDVTLSAKRMEALVATAERLDLKLIIWMTLYPSSTILRRLYMSSAVSAVVCVEQQSFERHRDHPIIEKMVVVPYGNPIKPCTSPSRPFVNREKMVVFLGSLVPQKGFGLLARAWPKVLRKVPAAQLQVIGSGTLYSRYEKLGRWGVANEIFEARDIRPYLANADGNISQSVQFLGNLGREKAEILKNAMVGIANPSGHTELFCLSAVEIQAAGVPVIAGAKHGLFDTVQHGKTGYLVSSVNELANRIIDLLSDPLEAERMGSSGKAYVTEKYDFEKIVLRWISFLQELSRGTIIKYPVTCSKPMPKSAALVRCNEALKEAFGSPQWWLSYVDVVEFFESPIIMKMRRNIAKIRDLYR